MAYPKTLGASVDQAYEMRKARLDLEKKVEEMKAEEKTLEEHILKIFDQQGLMKGGSANTTAAISTRRRAMIMDWKRFSDYVIKTKQPDLLEKRPAQTACQERWDDGVQIPGIEMNETRALSLTKIK
jgi:short subunit dehydrogenase-like uncharacterized protein